MSSVARLCVVQRCDPLRDPPAEFRYGGTVNTHDDATCHLCALLGIDAVHGRGTPLPVELDSAANGPDQSSLGERLADMLASISHLEWQYSRLMITGDLPVAASGSFSSAGTTVTGVVAALGQVRRALNDADSAWTTAQSRSARLTHADDAGHR